MRFNNPARKGQSQPRAGTLKLGFPGRMAIKQFTRLIKLGENHLLVARINPHPCIADDNFHPTFRQVAVVGGQLAAGDGDFAAVRRKFDGVNHQVVEQFPQGIRVSFDRRQLRQVEGQFLAAFTGRFGKLLRHRANQLGHKNILFLQFKRTRVHLGDVEHRIHDFMLAQGTLMNTLDQLADIFGQVRFFEQHFSITAGHR